MDGSSLVHLVHVSKTGTHRTDHIHPWVLSADQHPLDGIYALNPQGLLSLYFSSWHCFVRKLLALSTGLDHSAVKKNRMWKALKIPPSFIIRGACNLQLCLLPHYGSWLSFSWAGWSRRPCLISTGVWFSKNCLIVGRNLGQVRQRAHWKRPLGHLLHLSLILNFSLLGARVLGTTLAWAEDSEGGQILEQFPDPGIIHI